MRNCLIVLMSFLASTQVYANSNREMVDKHIREIAQEFQSSEFGSSLNKLKDSIDSDSLIKQSLSSGSLEQANQLSREQIQVIKVEFAKKLSQLDQNQWVSFIDGFNNFSPIKLEHQEIMKLAQSFNR